MHGHQWLERHPQGIAGGRRHGKRPAGRACQPAAEAILFTRQRAILDVAAVGQVGQIPVDFGQGGIIFRLPSGARRKRDLEATFLSFPVETADGRFHDRAMQEHFRVAFLRAGQAWDQTQARVQTHRCQTRQKSFRQQLARLLDGDTYAAIDQVTKERLLDEIPALAFPPRGIGP